MEELSVVEIFFGLQGESVQIGVPSVFIRLGGCSLSCKGFGCKEKSPIDGSILTGCDSIFAVNKKHFSGTWTKYDSWQYLSINIDNKVPVGMIYSEEKSDIVITGGEPLLWHKNTILINLIQYYISRGHKVWFETNGTIPVNFNLYPIYKKCSFIISVKMSLSGEPKEKRWKPDTINNYLINSKESYFKFVLSKDTLEEDKLEMIELLGLIPTYGIVYCMPLGATIKELEYNAKAVYEFSVENNFRYSDRIQIRIFNDKKGV